mmetsp:Transcript_25766/g.88198  ORF Transcript_25766/g.88198 Transcript_25766/m.88198 type:complete len:262 (-) Transcript_25766:230-1015(-)
MSRLVTSSANGSPARTVSTPLVDTLHLVTSVAPDTHTALRMSLSDPSSSASSYGPAAVTTYVASYVPSPRSSTLPDVRSPSMYTPSCSLAPPRSSLFACPSRPSTRNEARSPAMQPRRPGPETCEACSDICCDTMLMRFGLSTTSFPSSVHDSLCLPTSGQTTVPRNEPTERSNCTLSLCTAPLGAVRRTATASVPTILRPSCTALTTMSVPVPHATSSAEPASTSMMHSGGVTRPYTASSVVTCLLGRPLRMSCTRHLPD